MKPHLDVDLNGLRFPQPVLSASGCLATGHDVPGLVDLSRLGGVVTRSLTFGPSKGWATPRASETPSGLLTAVGYQNPGVLAFLEEDLPSLRKAEVPVVASVAGGSLGEYVNVASSLHLKPGVVALEVCVSCPDDEREGEPFYARPERLTEVVGAVARLSRVPVFAKLPPLLPALVETAQSCVRAGAFGLTLIDQVPALAVDPAEDAIEFLLAGAWAVQVGTALLVDPSVHVDIAQGILGYLREKGFASPDELRGRVRVPDAGNGSS
jgi:dihydroorotate dehydrogenase (NAD+) catalytic subunit